ncbi:MAG: xanthine dehydrogenase family protein subunit M [Rhodospirillaceae bacterium]|jgi:CO/xanthine dehydrogenase FAD-binding subunit
MDQVRYEAPNSLDAAIGLLSDADGMAKIFAGGTDVMVQIHSDLIEPSLIVNVKNIPELSGITESDGSYTVGAATPVVVMQEHEGFCKMWPGVIEGAELIGSVQVKGRSTIVGNLCNASPAADSVPPCIAAGATVRIVGPNGEREAPVEDIVLAPRQISLQKGEIIVSTTFPARAPHSGDCYLRLTPRTEMDIAIVGAGVNLTLDDSGTCIAARVALGAVAPKFLLVQECADALIGTKVDDAALSAMGRAASAAADPISDKRGTREYRIKTTAVMARRAAERALQRAREN